MHAELWPQRTLLLDLPVAQGLARARARRGLGDRFEDEESRASSSACAQRYLRDCAAEPQRVRLIDASHAARAAAGRQALAALADLF